MIYSYPLFQITIRWLIATSYSIYFNDLSASDDLERAELFNKYFHLVYTSSAFTLHCKKLFVVLTKKNCHSYELQVTKDFSVDTTNAPF